ncbi:hypothetical protein AB0L65_56040 [Nonomuraea sp. NPDC052116]|uniref:hypothetical protein n=1 Tax=Nonomuraea sp. NPDC052116 TaxID=3155665 RepID=UPI003415FF7E
MTAFVDLGAPEALQLLAKATDPASKAAPIQAAPRTEHWASPLWSPPPTPQPLCEL